MASVPHSFLTDRSAIVQEFSFDYPITNFKDWSESGTDKLLHSSFSPHRDQQWYIEIPVKESYDRDVLGRHFKLILAVKANEADNFVARMSILNGQREPQLQKEILGFSYAGTSGIYFFSTEALKSLTNDTGGLTINVHIFKLKPTVEIRPTISQVPKSDLAIEVLKWFKSEDFGDVTIESNDGEKFRFYKGILITRSEVFKLMFQSGMKEAKENYVKIGQFNCNVVASLLRFVYTNDVEDIGGFAHDLYAAAHIYQLDRLKSISESVLIAQLSSESIVASLQLAICYRVDKLMDNCIAFLQRYKNRLPMVDLMTEVVKASVKET